MFHVQLRQFPHVARGFNLTKEELEASILRPWVAGRPVDFQERRWAPERGRIAIYEGRALASEEIGLGRGWANAGRTGLDVTARMLAEAKRTLEQPPTLDALKRALLSRAAQRALSIQDVVELAAELDPQAPDRDTVTLAGRAVWELLQAGKLSVSAD
jgi:hypothetical protein